MGQVAFGQRALFTVDAHPEHNFTGTVSQIRLNASISQHVVTYDVIVDIDNEDGLLLPFMTANIKFIVDERRDIFKAPLEALSWRSPKRTAVTTKDTGGGASGSQDDSRRSGVLWVHDSDGIRSIEVSSGLSDRVFVEVAGSELAEGLPIVVGLKQRQSEDFGSTILKRIQGL